MQSSTTLFKFIDLNEASILNRYKFAYEVFLQKCSDLPTTPCISCERLFRKGDLKSVEPYKERIENNKLWDDLMKIYTPDKIKGDFICQFCISKLSKGIMPSMCILNNLFIKAVPEEISSLNPFETMLIQRVKPFQCVTKLSYGKKITELL